MTTTAPEMITITIDDREVSVPKGTNIVEAAKKLGVEIPHYCYHQNLSVAGNCRMCQVAVEGAPKLMIACHTPVAPNMKVRTQLTSAEVKSAQEATLEFILINHPLDCTVCDQAGHCKLQDYHFEYNGKASRFIEEKVHKVKAEPLGPNVILDGERCIMCTRCIRFCDEVTKTSELGMVNRGDRSMISINPGKELNNPLSGTVVDLCPVGALTHRNWRFNTRIWYTDQKESICPGCSTGCNVKVATRDNKVVNVKARMNQAVNKEWLCDQGRYGFDRFTSTSPLLSNFYNSEICEYSVALKTLKVEIKNKFLILLSPDLLLEDYAAIKEVINTHSGSSEIVLAFRERSLTEVEKILISPDYAANFRAAEFTGLISGDLEAKYNQALNDLVANKYERVMILGNRGIFAEDLNTEVLAAFDKLKFSAAIIDNTDLSYFPKIKLVFAGRSILQKSGLMINRNLRLQYADRVLNFADKSNPEWRIFNDLSAELGKKIFNAKDDRAMTLEYLASVPLFKSLSIKEIKQGGVLVDYSSRNATLGTEVQALPIHS